jgi:hypothetical protein
MALRTKRGRPGSRQVVVWKVVSTGVGVLSGVLVRQAIGFGWKKLTSGREDPPLNPADRRVSWSEGLQWAVASGIGVGVARLVGDRLAARGWEAATGHPPPGIES